MILITKPKMKIWIIYQVISFFLSFSLSHLFFLFSSLLFFSSSLLPVFFLFCCYSSNFLVNKDRNNKPGDTQNFYCNSYFQFCIFLNIYSDYFHAFLERIYNIFSRAFEKIEHTLSIKIENYLGMNFFFLFSLFYFSSIFFYVFLFIISLYSY